MAQREKREWEWCDDERAPTHARKPRVDQAAPPPSPPGVLGRELSRDIARLDRERAERGAWPGIEYVDYAFEPAAVRERQDRDDDPDTGAGAEHVDAAPSPEAPAPPVPHKALRFAYS